MRPPARSSCASQATGAPTGSSTSVQRGGMGGRMASATRHARGSARVATCAPRTPTLGRSERISTSADRWNTIALPPPVTCLPPWWRATTRWGATTITARGTLRRRASPDTTARVGSRTCARMGSMVGRRSCKIPSAAATALPATHVPRDRWSRSRVGQARTRRAARTSAASARGRRRRGRAGRRVSTRESAAGIRDTR